MDSDLVWTGEKIKDLRHRLGWSQAELAKRLGCRQQTISEWETNVYQPQNAYSQLLDRIFEDSQNFQIRTAQVRSTSAIIRKSARPIVSKLSEEETTPDSFDSFID